VQCAELVNILTLPIQRSIGWRASRELLGAVLHTEVYDSVPTPELRALHLVELLGSVSGEEVEFDVGLAEAAGEIAAKAGFDGDTMVSLVQLVHNMEAHCLDVCNQYYAALRDSGEEPERDPDFTPPSPSMMPFAWPTELLCRWLRERRDARARRQEDGWRPEDDRQLHAQLAGWASDWCAAAFRAEMALELEKDARLWSAQMDGPAYVRHWARNGERIVKRLAAVVAGLHMPATSVRQLAWQLARAEQSWRQGMTQAMLSIAYGAGYARADEAAYTVRFLEAWARRRALLLWGAAKRMASHGGEVHGGEVHLSGAS
jgi:hypothetical protein